jgi:hypothetical protein
MRHDSTLRSRDEVYSIRNSEAILMSAINIQMGLVLGKLIIVAIHEQSERQSRNNFKTVCQHCVVNKLTKLELIRGRHCASSSFSNL